MTISERLQNVTSPSFYHLINLFEVCRQVDHPQNYFSDQREWRDVLKLRSRDDGGIGFAAHTCPEIDVSYRQNFKPIMLFGSEHDTDLLGINATDFHIFFNDVLFEMLMGVYPKLNDSVNIHSYYDERRYGSVDVHQLIPLVLSQTGHTTPSAYYYYIEMESNEFGAEEFAGFVFNSVHGDEVRQILQQHKWIRRVL